MKISIITATYNSASTLRDTLVSVSSQDYPDIEHLIIDGLSKDDSLEIAAGFPHVAKIVSEKDQGIYDAMNKGIALAGGDIIGILNSDDFYVDEKVLSRVMKAFEDPAVDIVYGDLQYVKPEQTDKITRHWRAGKFRLNKFYFGWMPPHPSFFVRRQVYAKVGNFNTGLRSAADYELMLRILVKHRMRPAYIPHVLVRMRQGGMSNASLRNRLRANREDSLAWKLNGLRPCFFTTLLKPMRKIMQFLRW